MFQFDLHEPPSLEEDLETESVNAHVVGRDLMGDAWMGVNDAWMGVNDAWMGVNEAWMGVNDAWMRVNDA